MEENKINELDILFPGKKVEIGPNIFVTVKPITAEDLPKALKPFSDLFYKVASGIPPQALAVEAMGDAMAVLPFCIDREIKQIPITALPELLQAMIEVNLPPDTIKKWKALADAVTELGGKAQGTKEIA